MKWDSKVCRLSLIIIDPFEGHMQDVWKQELSNALAANVLTMMIIIHTSMTQALHALQGHAPMDHKRYVKGAFSSQFRDRSTAIVA